MEEQVAIFCDADDFCKAYEEYCQGNRMKKSQKYVIID